MSEVSEIRFDMSKLAGGNYVVRREVTPALEQMVRGGVWAVSRIQSDGTELFLFRFFTSSEIEYVVLKRAKAEIAFLCNSDKFSDLVGEILAREIKLNDVDKLTISKW